MKYIATLLIILLIIQYDTAFAETPLPYLTPQCPKEEELVETTSKDKEELLKIKKNF
ncbi:hypothetical protein SAMN05444673_4085 [Bacillus sp. OV166]|uniref:hypothetical protein n=1 Tax=Bacillus sp. OV166 TaxID=1882763 RepID=UPI000A2AD9EB|nr:hypothetical protein [Bacillus sp. OV166]SMQ81004.1 hypothetical protein SAMN05444673_4085 [Bacillus sp. OV166]